MAQMIRRNTFLGLIFPRDRLKFLQPCLTMKAGLGVNDGFINS